ncbi:hypothetical protein SCYAM73S_04388 [Streptomyces cyaneofuscatus]
MTCVPAASYVVPVHRHIDDGVGAHAGFVHSTQEAVPPVTDLPQLLGAAHVGDAAVSGLQKVPACQQSAKNVVGGHRAHLILADRPVDDDAGDVLAAQHVPGCPVRVDGRQQHAAHPLLGEERQVGLLGGRALGTVADHHPEPGPVRRLFRTPCQGGEEGVAGVRHEQAQHAASSRAELTCRFAPDVPEDLDGRLHTCTRLLGHLVRPVQDVGHRAHGYSCFACYLLDPHHSRPSVHLRSERTPS